MEKASSVVLNFKMDGQVKYAETLKQINSVMNVAAKEYKNHVAEMGKDASATDKLSAEKKKLEIQMEGAQKRTKMLSDEFESMSKDTSTTTEQLTRMQGKLLDSERAEISLQKSLDRVNEGLSEQAQESRNNQDALGKLNTEQSELEVQSKKLTSEYKLQSSELGDNATEAEKNALAQEHLAKQSELAGKQIANLEDQLALAKNEFGENSIQANKMETELNEAKTAFNNLGSEMDNVGDQADNAGTQMAGIKDALSAEALMNLSDKLSEISERLIEIGQAALEAFQEVDEGLDIIITKTGASNSDMAGMEKIFKNIASSLPIEDLSAVGSAIGEVNTQFGSMGDELEQQSIKLLKFSEINGQDVTDSAIQAKQAIEAYSLSNQDLGMVLDTVTDVSQKTGQSTQDLMNKAIEGAPQIKALGLEFSDGVQLMGEFEKAGVDSGGALSSLSKASVTYAKDGKDLKQGLDGTIKSILGAKSETEALTIASEVFGTKGSVRMLDAIQRGTINLEDFGSSAEDVAGKVETTFDDTLDPIDQMTITTNDAKMGMAELGGAIAETLLPVFELFSEAIKSITDWFGGLDSASKNLVVVFGLILVGISILLPIVLGLAAAITLITPAMIALVGSILSVIGVVALVIGGVVAFCLAIKTLWETNEGFRTAVTEIWTAISSVFLQVIQQISSFVMSIFGSLVTWWNENNSLILASAKVIWANILATIQSALNILVPIFQLAMSVLSGVASVSWNLIKGIIKTGTDAILGIVKFAMQILTGDWNGAWTTLWTTLGGILKNITNTLTSTLNSILSSVTNIFGKILVTGESIWKSVGDAISNPITKAKELVRSAIEAIKGFMDFNWSLPKIKMPHFSVSGSANPMTWLSDGVPKIKVDWRAKGGIFTQPTIFGASGGRLQGIGEAGPEAALPLNDETLGAIGRGIAKTMSGGVTVNQKIYGNNLDARETARLSKINYQKAAYEIMKG